MRVPDVVRKMRELADRLKLKKFSSEANELNVLADELRRRPGVARAKATSAPMTPQLKKDIRDYAKSNPGMSQQAIAEQFNVNHGRVSEALRGKRI